MYVRPRSVWFAVQIENWMCRRLQVGNTLRIELGSATIWASNLPSLFFLPPCHFLYSFLWAFFGFVFVVYGTASELSNLEAVVREATGRSRRRRAAHLSVCTENSVCICRVRMCYTHKHTHTLGHSHVHVCLAHVLYVHVCVCTICITFSSAYWPTGWE